jgi:hypothetical protein
VSIGNRRNSRWPRDMNLPYFSHLKCKSIEILGFERIIKLKNTVIKLFRNLQNEGLFQNGRCGHW